MSISMKLREIADRIDVEYKGGETLKFDSQNMDYHNMKPYLVEKCDGSDSDISCRGERLSHDEITIHAKEISSGGRGRGIFQTPDGKFWKVRGCDGDAYYASSMRFEEISEETVLETIRKRAGR